MEDVSKKAQTEVISQAENDNATCRVPDSERKGFLSVCGGRLLYLYVGTLYRYGDRVWHEPKGRRDRGAGGECGS